MDAATTIPTWGYKPDGSADIFDLAPGESLPAGWEASPACITDPDLATADALSARAEGREYVLPAADPVSWPRVEGESAVVDPDALASALAEIERLTGIIAAGTAENEALHDKAERDGADIQRALDLCEKYGIERNEAQAAVETLKGELEAAAQDIAALREALATAGDDKTAALAAVETLTADLAKARADLDEVLAAPAETKPAKASK